jgi:hypothetical protein
MKFVNVEIFQCITTSYGLDDQGVRVRISVRSRIFSFPRRPDRFWVPPSLLSSGYQGLFPWGLSDWCKKLTTHLQLVPRSRKRGSIRPLPHTPSWCSAWLAKHRDNFNFYLYRYFSNSCLSANNSNWSINSFFLFCTVLSCLTAVALCMRPDSVTNQSQLSSACK